MTQHNKQKLQEIEKKRAIFFLLMAPIKVLLTLILLPVFIIYHGLNRIIQWLDR